LFELYFPIMANARREYLNMNQQLAVFAWDLSPADTLHTEHCDVLHLLEWETSIIQSDGTQAWSSDDPEINFIIDVFLPLVGVITHRMAFNQIRVDTTETREFYYEMSNAIRNRFSPEYKGVFLYTKPFSTDKLWKGFDCMLKLIDDKPLTIQRLFVHCKNEFTPLCDKYRIHILNATRSLWRWLWCYEDLVCPVVLQNESWAVCIQSLPYVTLPQFSITTEHELQIAVTAIQNYPPVIQQRICVFYIWGIFKTIIHQFLTNDQFERLKCVFFNLLPISKHHLIFYDDMNGCIGRVISFGLLKLCMTSTHKKELFNVLSLVFNNHCSVLTETDVSFFNTHMC